MSSHQYTRTCHQNFPEQSQERAQEEQAGDCVHCGQMQFVVTEQQGLVRVAWGDHCLVQAAWDVHCYWC